MSDTPEPVGTPSETEELWKALAEMQLAFNRQGVMLRVAFNLLQSMGFNESLLDKIYQLEAVKMFGATCPEDSAEVMQGHQQEIEFLIGEPLTPEKIEEVVGLFRVEQRVAAESAKKEEEQTRHPEQAVIFGGGKRIIQ